MNLKMIYGLLNALFTFKTDNHMTKINQLFTVFKGKNSFLFLYKA